MVSTGSSRTPWRALAGAPHELWCHLAVPRGGSRAAPHCQLPGTERVAHRRNARAHRAVRRHTRQTGSSARMAGSRRPHATRPARSPRVTERVLIADDQQLIRDGFRMILATATDIEIVGEASNGAEPCPCPRAAPGRRADGHPHARTRRDRSHPPDPRPEPGAHDHVLILTTSISTSTSTTRYAPERAGSSSRTSPRASSSPPSAPSGTATHCSRPASRAA